MAWIFYWVPFGATSQAIAEASTGYLSLAFAFGVTTLGLRVARWLIWVDFASQPHQSLARRPLIVAYLTSTLYGVVTIGRLGELWKAKSLCDKGWPWQSALGLVVLERVLDVGVILAVLAGAALVVGGVAPAGIGIALTIALLMAWPCLGERSVHLMATTVRPIAGKLAPKFMLNLATPMVQLGTDMARPKEYGWIMGLTLSGWLTYVATLIAVATSLGLSVSWTVLGLLGILGALCSVIPITWNGLGLRELMYIHYLAREGIPEHVAVSMSFLFFSVFLLVSVVFGLIGFGAHRGSTALDVGGDLRQRFEGRPVGLYRFK